MALVAEVTTRSVMSSVLTTAGLEDVFPVHLAITDNVDIDAIPRQIDVQLLTYIVGCTAVVTKAIFNGRKALVASTRFDTKG